MIPVQQSPRNLHVSSAYGHYLPTRPDDWRDDELDAWRRDLVASGRWNAAIERAWSNLLRLRDVEAPQQSTVLYRRAAPLPPEVLAQMPLAVMAQGTYWRCPRLARLSHRLASLLDRLPQGEGANYAAMRRMADGFQAFESASWVAAVYTDGLLLAGGLQIRFLEGRFHVALGDRRVASGPCHDAAIRRLQLLVLGWACLIRMIVATSLQHAIPVFRRSLATPLQFALPVPVRQHACNGLILAAGRVETARLTLLGESSEPAEWGGRLRVARAILRASRGCRRTQEAIDIAVADIARTVDLLRPITVPMPSRAEILSRLDSQSGQNIRAWAGPDAVPLDDARADTFHVFQDDITGQRHLATFRALGLAVDFERSNRRQITARLYLSTAA